MNLLPRSRALGALLTAAALVAAGASESRPAEPGFYRVSAELGSPFAARWLDVGERELVVSDLVTGVGAVRLETGVVAWSRLVEGGVRGVWAAGTTVLAAGDQLTAWRRSVGTRLWERSLRCRAKAPCDERVLHVDGGGVYLVGGVGGVQVALQRLDLETGEPVWSRPIVAAHPIRAIGDARTLVYEEGLPPFGLVLIDKATGAERGRWAQRVANVPRPVSEFWLGPRGDLLVADLRPRDGLARAMLVDSEGHEVLAATVPRPAGLTTSPIFAAAAARRLALFAPDAAVRGGSIVTFDLARASAAPVVAAVATWRRPVEAGGRWVFADAVGPTATAWGFDPSAEAPPWTRELGGWPAGAPLALWAAGGLVIASSGAEPLVLWSIDAASGEVVGYRQLRLDGAKVGAVGADEEGLLVAIDGGIVRLGLEPVARAAAAFDGHLAAGRPDDARALAAELGPLAPMSPTVRAMLERGAGARLEWPARQLADGALPEGFEGLGAIIEAAADAEALAVALGATARLVGRHVVAPRAGPPRRAHDALLGLGVRAVAAMNRHGAAFAAGGAQVARQPGVRSALVVLALGLERVSPAAAADVLETLRGPAWSPDEAHKALDRVLCTRALAATYRAQRAGLLSAKAEPRRAAARALDALRHGDFALADPGYLARSAEAAADEDARYARDAAKLLDQQLAERLRELGRTYGKGYTPVGCELACASLGQTCAGACHDAATCAATQAACAAGCARGGVLRWPLPKAPKGCAL